MAMRFQTHSQRLAPGSQRTAVASRSAPAARRSAVAVHAANPAAGEKYDYIIVGGGTAGCVLANRLTASGAKKVLVLEAGSDHGALEVKVPAGITRLFKHPVLDWGLSTIKQQQLENKEVYLARGKLLGGSSCTNATLYHRGSAADYDAWGLPGWSSAEVLEWFCRAETYEKGASKYHGGSGVMRVENPRYETALHDEFFRAAAAKGLAANPDFNDWSRPQTGYGEFQVTQQEGERADMYRQYLKPARERGNLKVVTGARTTKVNIDGKRARGVDFVQGGERCSAELAAGGEVLLAAGAVHSPHLLMLSGIGPAKTLAEHGIPLVADVAGVGANLQDHPAVLFSARTKPEYDELTVTSQIYNKSNNIKLSAVLQYLFGRKGPLATTGCDHGAFVSTTGKGEADLQMRFVPALSLEADGVSAYATFGELKRRGLNWPGGVTMQLLAVRPRSRGSVGLRSSDPMDRPKLDVGYFRDEAGADLATLMAGLKLSRELAATPAMAKLVSEEAFPGAAASSDAELEAYVRRTVHSGNALVGTCAMGASASAGAVVSSADLSVFGVDGLRVIDASVVPVMPGGQTGAVAVMIAERAADVLTSGQAIGRSAGARVPAAV